jgi:hypothetical protein
MARPTKPPLRLVVERSSNNEKRRLRDPLPRDGQLKTWAERARYGGSGKHKLKPRAFGLKPAPSGADDIYCDGHAGFLPADLVRAPELLRRGVLAGLVGRHDTRDDPTMLWTIDDNGWIYECRITVPTRALYHGYPLLPGDAFAKKVIERYASWITAQPSRNLRQTLEKALDRYR